MATAARAHVAEHERNELAVLGQAAQRQRVDEGRAGRIVDAVHDAVGQDALVVDRGAPGLRERIALAVEPPQPSLPDSRVGRVAGRTDTERRGHERQRVLEHRPEIEQDERAILLGDPRAILPYPELEKLRARQIDARGRKGLGNRAPARPVGGRAHPVGRAEVRRPGRVVREPQHRIRLQHEPQDRLGGLRLPGELDRRVDLLRKELDRLQLAVAVVVRQALPGQKRGVDRIEAGRDPVRFGAARRGGNIAPVPGVVGQRDEPGCAPFELLDVRLPELVGARLGKGDFTRDGERRRRIGAHARQEIGETRQPPRLEVELRRHAADEAGRWLEPQRRAVE